MSKAVPLAVVVTVIAVAAVALDLFGSESQDSDPAPRMSGLPSDQVTKNPEPMTADGVRIEPSPSASQANESNEPEEVIDTDESRDQALVSKETKDLQIAVRAAIAATGLDPSVVDDAGAKGVEAIRPDLNIFLDERKSLSKKVNDAIQTKSVEKLERGDIEIVSDSNVVPQPRASEYVARGSRSVDGRVEHFVIRVFDEEVPGLPLLREQIRQIDHEIGTMSHALLWEYLRQR